MKLYKVSAMDTSFKELLNEFDDLIEMNKFIHSWVENNFGKSYYSRYWLNEDNTGTFIDYGSHVYQLYVDAVLM